MEFDPVSSHISQESESFFVKLYDRRKKGNNIYLNLIACRVVLISGIENHDQCQNDQQKNNSKNTTP